MTLPALDTLKAKLGEINDLHAIGSVLSWDEEVYMPPKGAEARGRHKATLAALAHRLFTSDAVGGLIGECMDHLDQMEPDDAALVAEANYDHGRAIRLPESFVQRLTEEQSRAYGVWVDARKNADFGAFASTLATVVDLLREKAELQGYEGSPYNALLEDYERGMTAEAVKPIFARLAEEQSAIVEAVLAKPERPSLDWTRQTWPEDAQWEMTMEVLREMGYDFGAGRQDKSVHPFTINFDTRDVRITTRVDPDDPFSALTGSMHEAGHALYEQGFLDKDRHTLLAAAPSLGIHESQSRMWENIIGRSLPFWRHCAPLMRRYFPDNMAGVSPEDVYAAITHVAPSLIRVEADECTYNLHVIIRFEIELGLIEGALSVKDVPEAWNARMGEYLGVEVPNDAQGCLQDIHWSHAAMGYFPTYALGNLYAAQLFEQVEKDVPDIWEQVGAGSFAGLLAWLREHVHHVGRRKTAAGIVEAATGQPPSADAFLRYLRRKFVDAS